MKKLLTILLAMCLLMTFAACGGKPVENPTPSQEVTYTPEQTFSFQYKGVAIALHDPAEPIIAALGEPVKYTESASCAFEGLDKSYYYGSFYLETYPQGDKDFVSGWWFADDSVATPEGIYIGSTQAQVEKAYGSDGYNGSNAYTVNKEAGMLTIILDNGAVSSIQYSIK